MRKEIDIPIGDRIDRCLGQPETLTLGEVELLRSIRSRRSDVQPLTQVEAKELHHIERKLGFT